MRRNRNGHKVDYGHKTFDEMMDDLDANIARIKAEISGVEYEMVGVKADTERMATNTARMEAEIAADEDVV